MAFDNGKVVLDGHAARIDLETRQKLDHGNRLVKLIPFAIQGDAHGNQWIGKCSSLVRPGPDPRRAALASFPCSVTRVCRASQGKLLMAIGLCE